MSTQYELVELLTYLESNEIELYNEIKTAIFDNLNKSKEPWLVNAVVDMFVASNSSRCLDVLVSITEPHDKHLFERLNDHVKGSQRLRALAILAHLVQHEPVWLHKITTVQLMQTVLRSLKVESDGLVLLTGALVLTGILPIVPVSIAPFLNDICEVFGALAAFCLNRSGNVPEIYLLHLQVGLHCMFHRLYSMYPWHLLTYLKAVYSRPENVAVFENVIKPMLSLVRMHPLLVMGSKEKETSRDRWKEKEVHDIIVECAQLSLDPFDREFADGRNLLGSWPDKRQQRLSRPEGNQDFSWISLMSSAKFSSSEDGSIGSLWSPSKDCGLYAPSVGSSEATEKGNQTTAQGTSANVSSQSSAVSLQLVTDGPPKETVSDASFKSDDASVESGAKATAAAAAAVIPPLMIEPPTPPDVTRGTDNKAPSGFFGVRQPPDGSVSLNDLSVNPQNMSASVCLAAPESVGPSEAEVSTAAMAALMKKVNRIRLNSINISRGDQKSTLQPSRSCPHLLSPTLYPLSGPAEDDDRLTASQGSLDGVQECSGSDRWMGPLTKSSLELAVAPIGSRASPVSVTTVSTESQTGFYVFSPRLAEHAPEGRAEAEELDEEGDPSTEGVHPFELMLGLVLPFAPFVQCYFCMRKHWDDMRAGRLCSARIQHSTGNQSPAKRGKHLTPKLDCITPLFMTYSPSSLLDRHILQSHEMHAKASDAKVTQSSSQTKTAGGSSNSSTSDVALLRGQVLLMHNQLMFERRRQELHAKRNRRLLGRTVKVVSLEEQNTAMRDQLRLQESEMAKLRSDLQFCRNQTHSLEECIRTDSNKFSEAKRSYISEVEDLKLRLKEVEESLASQKCTNEQLVQQLERTNNKLFAKEKDIELLRLKVDSLSHLERQVIQLNTELLLMGELHQKYQQRLSEMSVKPQSVRPQLQMCLDACKEECHSLRMQMKEKTAAFEEANARMEGIRSQHQLKEKNVAELKNELEQSQTLHLEHMQILEERYKNEKKAQLALQTRIFELQAEVELLKKKQPGRATPRSTHSTAIASGTGSDLEHATSSGSPAEHLRVASDRSSDHSLTDSPAHPGKN